MGRYGKLPDGIYGSDLMLFFILCFWVHIVYGIVCALVFVLKIRPMKIAVAGCIGTLLLAGLMAFFNFRIITEIGYAC